LLKLLHPVAAAKARQNLEDEINRRVDRKKMNDAAQQLIDIFNPRHDAEIGLSMFITQRDQYSEHGYIDRSMGNLLAAARVVDGAGQQHNDLVKHFETNIATKVADDFDFNLAQIEKLERILAIAKQKIVDAKAVKTKAAEQECATAKLAANQEARRRQREEAAAGFAIRDAALAEEEAERLAEEAAANPTTKRKDRDESATGSTSRDTSLKRQRRI
jgi:hypothetical protein